MSTNPPPNEQEIETALERLSKDDLLSIIKQMVQRHPDLTELIATIQPTAPKKQQRIPFKPEVYRRQVAEIFATTDRTKWGSEGRAAGPLLDIMDTGDTFTEQQQYAEAATLYEIIVRGILDNYHTFRWHADEGDLDDVVKEGVDGLGKCLLGAQNDTAMRRQIIQTLYDVYTFDMSLEIDEPVMSRSIPTLLVRYTTPEERQMIAGWVRQTFQLDINWHADNINENYDQLLLGLEADTIDDETFLRISRTTESYNYLVERLLKLGRLEEALEATKHVENYDILEIVTILCEYGHEAQAEKLIQKRLKKYDNVDLLEWLKERYQARGNSADALKMAHRIFRAYPLAATIERYREIRQLAEQLGQWETVQAEIIAFLKTSDNTTLQIKIALDEGQVEKALELLQSQKQSKNSPYGANNFNVGIDVAKAAEESYPYKSIEIYRRYTETRIEWRGRENYAIACQYLTNVRKLYNKIGHSEVWTSYITALCEHNRNLRALRDEMAKAGLI